MSNLATQLDGRRFGRFGFNKSISGVKPLITVYELENSGDEGDEQVTFTSDELVSFCRYVLRQVREDKAPTANGGAEGLGDPGRLLKINDQVEFQEGREAE
jgi:hypothetical protein